MSALLGLAGARRGLDRLEALHSSAQALLGSPGPRGSAGGGTQRPVIGSTVSGTSCPAVPEVLAGMLQRGKVGAGPRPWEMFLEEAAAVCTPARLHTACPHIAPGLADGYAGHGALPRAKETQPWLPTWAAKSLDGFEMADAPGWCCSWPGACGSPEPALGNAQPRGGPSSWVASSMWAPMGAPPPRPHSPVSHEGSPVPCRAQRGPAALPRSSCLGPAPERWLGKLLVWWS